MKVKVGDKIRIDKVLNENSSYRELVEGDIHTITEVHDKCFIIWKGSDDYSFSFDQINNDCCTYKLLNREEKLKRILK